MPVTTEKKPRKKPIPQSYDRILAGALKLQMSERVEMIKSLQAQNQIEVNDLSKAENEAKERLATAKLMLNGNG